MGLFAAWFEFDGAPPTQAELVAHLVAQLGSARGLDALAEIRPKVLELTCALDPITCGYAMAYLAARGGVRVGSQSNAPVPLDLPLFVSRPWRAWSLFQRLRFRVVGSPPLESPIRDGRYR